ncbi:hypothetical protein A0H81_12868 [Grifola frondosa]|uniref:GmrSD restriction endonucleases N-terminal domain-containing protein n=1 Tax=Grifola frondosa TaxID=5627 RepID=A0A1C7LSA9_GRIFR|nr:hypothetical protein A0H81_12868 [Grifola frondosa]
MVLVNYILKLKTPLVSHQLFLHSFERKSRKSHLQVDFDELQSDLDDYDDDGFHIGDRLDPPQARLYSTQDLHTLIHEGVIDLCPPYQRDIVWTEAKQVKLLDSLFRNFYVPPVVFAVYKDEDGEEVRKCVDGKQRLTSIQKFFDGQIPYRDPKNRRHFVPEHWKRDFASKQITCVEYHNLNRGFERDIFQRVQLGMPLTAAEKLQAIASPWAEFISDLDARFVCSDDGLTTVIDVDMKRGRNFQSLAQLVYCCDGYPEQLVPTPQKMEQWILNMNPPIQTFKTAIYDILTAFWHIAATPELNVGFTKIQKRVAPIEFVFIGVLLYVMRDASHEDRAREIYEMRKDIRKKYPDIRTRGDIVKSLWTFIDKLTTRQVEGGTTSDLYGKKKRRKTRDYDSDEEIADEYRPSSAKQYSKRPKGRR